METVEPEWAVCVAGARIRGQDGVPLRAGDAYFNGRLSESPKKFDAQGRAVFANADEALTLLKALTRNFSDSHFLLRAWWEKRDAARLRETYQDSDDAVREYEFAMADEPDPRVAPVGRIPRHRLGGLGE